MSRHRSTFIRAIRILLVLLIIGQQLLIPMSSLAYGSSNSDRLHSPLSVQQLNNRLIRGIQENVDTYLQRVAASDPALFQQASITAVQDAFNGSLPEVEGDKALEEQIAFYIQRVATGLPMQESSSQGTSASLTNADSYLWNGSQTNVQRGSGSEWQLIAHPGTDTNIFAQNFEQMLKSEALPSGTPLEAVSNDVSDTASSTSKQVLPIGHSTNKWHPVAPQAAQEIFDNSGMQWYDTPQHGHTTVSAIRERNNQSAPHTVSNTPVQTPQAKLAINVTAPISASFDSVITYTVAISNSGINSASLVELTHVLPANGIFQAPVSGCLTKDLNKVICSVGAVDVGQTKTFMIPVKMKGNGVLNSTLSVKDTFNTVNPASKLATTNVAVKVVSESRSVREVGKLAVAANEFSSFGGETEASGAVEIGYKKDGKYIYTLRLGADDTLAWTTTPLPQTLSSFANVSQIEQNFPLFKGEFSIDVTKDSLLIIPSAEITPTIKELAGFQLVNTAIISQVAVPTGIASFSANLKVSLPGITTSLVLTPTGTLTSTTSITPSQDIKKNTLVLTGEIKPGGKGEAKISEFEMFFSGLKVKIKDAVFSGDKITMKQALLTMPKKYGELTGIIAKIEMSATRINFGGVGVKIPIPNLYPMGKPITSTNALSNTAFVVSSAPVTVTQVYTPAISFIKNSATILYDNKDGVSLQLESTLDLHVPSNDKKIPVVLTLMQTGDITGTIKEINLKIAGQDLTMKQVAIGTSGLSVAEATLTFTFPTTKTDDKKTDGDTKPVTQTLALSLSQLPNATTATTPTSDKKKNEEKDKQLSIIVKDVSITKKGLSLGSVGVDTDLPDFGLGDVVRFTKNKFKVVVNNPVSDQTKPVTPTFEIEVEGTLKIQIKGSEVETKFSAKWDKEGKFSGKLKELTLTISSASLKLKDVEFNAKRFVTKSATLKLPPILGNTEVIVTDVVIDETGLNIGDSAVKIPVKFTIGKQGDDPNPTNSVSVSGTLGLLRSKDGAYGLSFEGAITIKLFAQSVEAEGAVRLTRDDDGKVEVRGSIDSFALTIVGMTLSVKEASIEGSTVKAREATFAVPKEWGGLSVSVYQIEISKEKGFSIGGGSFKLPEIKIGDMSLSLEGTLKRENNGWVIAAGGSLKLPNASSQGCSGLAISVEMFVGSNQQVVMQLQPLNPNAVDGFQFRQASLSLKCTIPLGTSGFDLTSVSGTVTLNSNVTKVEIKATMESKMGIGSFRAVTTDGNMSMEYIKNPYKFEIGIGASMKIFSMFEAARASAKMRFTDGDVPFLFTAEMNIDAVIARGDVKLTAWTRNGEFNLTGRIYGEVGLRRGSLVDRCWTIRVPGWKFWEKWREVQQCLRLPGDDLFIGAGMEFGKFKEGNGNTWGFKAGVNIAGANYGIYVDTNRNYRIGNVDQYRLIDTPSLLRALELHTMSTNKTLNRVNLTTTDRALLNDYHFVDGRVIVETVDITRPSDLMITMLRSTADNDVQITLERPDGLRMTGSNASGNVTFNESLMDARDVIAPNGEHPTDVPPIIETNLNVTNADMGQWRIILSRQPTNEFIINVSGAVYGPPVHDLAISGQNDQDNTVSLAWNQSTPLSSTVTIYATQDVITDTASYTKTHSVLRPDGITATNVVTVALGTVTKFGGYPIAQFEYAAGEQTIDELLDLESLQSGSYHVWLEVDDHENPPTRKYFPHQVTVLHPWDNQWNAATKITSKFGALDVSWDKHANPDVDGYEVHITSKTDDNADEDTYIVVAGDVLSQTITGLSAQQTYDITVVGYDSGTHRTSVAQSIAATPLAAPFAVTANPSEIVLNGGQVGTSSIVVASAISPYPDNVFLDFNTIPDGLDVELTTTVLTPTATGVESTLIITPSATLVSGVYTVTVNAMANGDVKTVSVPVTVQQPNFELRTSSQSLTVTSGGSTAVAIDATYLFGEQDPIFVDVLDMPEGIDWSLSQPSFLPNQNITLFITDTDYLAFGDYTITLLASDNEHTYTTTLPLSVAGFNLVVESHHQSRPSETNAVFVLNIDGAAWNHPVELAFDSADVNKRFITSISDGFASVPATINISVMPLADTAPGIYELMLNATSNGITQKTPLYVTVQELSTATDMTMEYQLLGDGVIIAGQPYSYTLSPRNSSLNPAINVRVVDTTETANMLTLVDSDGCLSSTMDNQIALACDLGTVSANTENTANSIAWYVNPDVAAGSLINHRGEVIVSTTNIYTETSTLDNIASLALTVERESDLSLIVDSAPNVRAGQSTTLTATVTNNGPSYADNALVEFYLPQGTSLQSVTTGCIQENDFVQCPVGVLALDQSRTVIATLTVDPDVRGEIEPLIAVDSDSYDPDLSNNDLYSVIPIETDTQLAVTILPQRTAAFEGESIEYIVSISNQGPSTATDVDINLDIPESADILDVQIKGVHQNLDSLDIEPNQTLTATISMLFPEDDHGQPMTIDVLVDSTEAAPILTTASAVSIANTNPTAAFTGTLAVNEGELGIISVYIDDRGGEYDPLDVAWDLDNDGQFDDASDAIIRFDARAIDGPATRPIKAKVVDDEGGQTIISGTVVVRNVAPTVDAGADQFKQYDKPFTINFATTDAFADVKTAQIDWGDSTVTSVSLSASATNGQDSHTYNTIGTFKPKVCVTDDDQGQACDEVVLHAMCRDNGLLVRIVQDQQHITIMLENASGNTVIPAGLPLTLYNGNTAIQTFTLDQELNIGETRTIQYLWLNASPGDTLRVAVDDSGNGIKTTDLCSGSVYKWDTVTKIHLPLLLNK